MGKSTSVLAKLIAERRSQLLSSWVGLLKQTTATKSGQIKDAELQEQAKRFIEELARAVQADTDSISGSAWEGLKSHCAEISRSRALQGFSPAETATFVFSFKEPLFAELRREIGADADRLADEVWTTTKLLDSLGLYTTEVFQRSREEVIERQQRELLELSTPVVQLWSKILALPLIGTLDSERTQIVMERLLNAIVEFGAEIAIIDISGVPTVDTLVAQHLIKTVSAARLMGADCVISGIRPQIAQTIVHLGLDLNVISKANMADAFALALKKTSQTVSAKRD